MRRTKSKDLEKVLKRVKSLEKKNPINKEILDFFKEIIREQYKAKPIIKIEPIEVQKETIKDQLMAGFPLIDKNGLKLDIDSAKIIFKNICKALREKNKKVAPWIRIINKSIKSKDISLEELYKKMIEGDDTYINSISDKIGINKWLLNILLENSIKPIFESYAERLKDYIEQESWFKGSCPICGSEPFLGELKDYANVVGAKFLICSLCGFHWRYKRLGCPFCSNDNHQKLRYFNTEADGKAYRIDVCEECKRYIKTIDTKIIGDVISPLIEDISTLHLDIIANNEGYKGRYTELLEKERYGVA